MTTVTRNYRFKVRGRTAAAWTSDNEVLLERELGLETDTRKFKFGDGTTAWNSLAYASEPTPTNISAFTNDAGYLTSVSDANWSGADLAVTNGGTGASTASAARTNLGLAIGTDVQAYDADLAAVAGLASSGLVVRTGAGTASARTLTGTANELTVTNGDGVSGNPTVSLPSALTFTGKTITGGTLSGVTLSGATTGPGGFGVDSSGFVTGGGTNAWAIGAKAGVIRIDHNGTTFRCLTAAGGNAPLQALNLVATSLVQGATFRLEQTPVAQTITCTHTVVINVSGTNYLFPCRAA